MESRRERRRRDLRRMKDRARRYARMNEWPDQSRAEHNADHLALCSRGCCGNQRHNPWLSREERRTMQERRFLAEEIE